MVDVSNQYQLMLIAQSVSVYVGSQDQLMSVFMQCHCVLQIDNYNLHYQILVIVPLYSYSVSNPLFQGTSLALSREWGLLPAT